MVPFLADIKVIADVRITKDEKSTIYLKYYLTQEASI
jgi:hypothetical protein